MFFDPLYLIMMAPALLLALWAQLKVKRAFSRYSKVANSKHITGAQVAKRILEAEGIFNVSVERVDGRLSDHYDPRARVLRLSPDVYGGSSVAAMGIAAHEVGHAIQHARAYGPLILRQTIAPVASMGSNAAFFLIFIGLMVNALGLVYLGIIGFSIATFFTLVTLPVEFDASARAKKLLPAMGLANAGELKMVNKVLSAAAMTYVAAAISAILTLVYWLLRAGILGGRDD